MALLRTPQGSMLQTLLRMRSQSEIVRFPNEEYCWLPINQESIQTRNPNEEPLRKGYPPQKKKSNPKTTTLTTRETRAVSVNPRTPSSYALGKGFMGLTCLEISALTRFGMNAFASNFLPLSELYHSPATPPAARTILRIRGEFSDDELAICRCDDKTRALFANRLDGSCAPIPRVFVQRSELPVADQIFFPLPRHSNTLAA